MMLGTKSRYGVMAMAELASRACKHPVSLAEIAEAQEIPLPYLEQLFNRLKKSELVVSSRGPGGGYALAVDASRIRISDIVEAVDEPMKMTRCDGRLKKGCMADKSSCVTHDLWAGLGEHIHDYLASITLADLCKKNNPLAKAS